MSGAMGDTSDIGQMYRQFLQSKGVPVTPDNMRRAVEESRRNPNMLEGLRVQQDAPVPQNVAEASGTQRAVPQALPGKPMPSAAPPSPGGTGGNVPPPQSGVNPAASISQQGPPTPPPGQAPAPGQSSITSEGGGLNLQDLVMGLLGTSGAAAPSILSLVQKLVGGGGAPGQPQPQMQPSPEQTAARDEMLARGGHGEPLPQGVPSPEQAAAREMQLRQGGHGGPMTPTEPIGNILTEQPAPPMEQAAPPPGAKVREPGQARLNGFVEPNGAQSTPSPEQMAQREALLKRGGMGGSMTGQQAAKAARLRIPQVRVP